MTKLYASIPAARLGKVSGNLLSEDQKGFVKGRQMYQLSHELIGSIDLAVKHKIQLAIITLDATKAFDRVNWQFLYGMLSRYNLGKRFCRAIQEMYRDPDARILVNSNLTSSFKTTRGTRQGCLSPFSAVIQFIY